MYNTHQKFDKHQRPEMVLRYLGFAIMITDHVASQCSVEWSGVSQ